MNGVIGLDDLNKQLKPAQGGAGGGDAVERVERIERPLIQPVLSLNYAMLHNKAPIFESFTLRNSFADAGAGNVQVIVDLFQGELSAPYRCVHTLPANGRRLQLHRKNAAMPIRLPLASRLMRSLKEPLLTTMLVQVYNTAVPPSLLVERTYSITLEPVRQWRDNGTDSQWLPSFIQPNDPAVLQIIQQARKFLMALRDDATVGFDGYMSLETDAPEVPDDNDDTADEVDTADAEDADHVDDVDDDEDEDEDEEDDDPDDDDPDDDEDEDEEDDDEDTDDDEDEDEEDEDGGENYRALDAQVRAIWCSLLYDHDLNYINPPPTYRLDSQLLRMPSEVVAGRRGTCIDLALLVASCLEQVEIYPVVFLLKGHCFPGYWRSGGFRRQFKRDAVRRSRQGRITGPWYFEAESYPQIREAVAEGRLVPLEAVRLTDRSSFQTALDEGLENLRTSVGFEAMIDVQYAREKAVTPLPLAGDF